MNTNEWFGVEQADERQLQEREYFSHAVDAMEWRQAADCLHLGDEGLCLLSQYEVSALNEVLRPEGLVISRTPYAAGGWRCCLLACERQEQELHDEWATEATRPDAEIIR